MKKLYILILLLRCFCVYGQQTKPFFKPENYPFVYFGPTTQTVIIDPDLNTVLSPAPFDRFFYLRAYSKDDNAQLLTLAYKTYLVAPQNESKVKAGDKVATFTPLFTRKPQLAVGSADAKAGYTLYEALMPPLSPQGKYEFTGYYAISDRQIAGLTKAVLLLKQLDDSGNFKQLDNQGNKGLEGVRTLLGPVNAVKDKDDYEIFTAEYLQIYYTEKIKNKLNGANATLSGEEMSAIISNYFRQDISISISDSQLKQIFPNYQLSKKKEDDLNKQVDRPIFYNIKKLSDAQFKSFVVDTRTSSVVTVDAGYVFFGFPPSTFFRGTPYIGIDFYFRAFDPAIPYSYVRKFRETDGLNFFNNFSVNFGITLNSQAKQYYRADLFGNDNIIGGLGYRFNNLFKINAGALAYYKLDPNFLINNKTVKLTPYIGASIDIRVGTIFSSFSKLFSL